MSRADGLVRGPGAGAEVELLDGEAFVVETDVVRPAGCPVLDVAQIGVSIDQHVSATEQKQQSAVSSGASVESRAVGGVPAVQRRAVTSHRERGQSSLELSESGGR